MDFRRLTTYKLDINKKSSLDGGDVKFSCSGSRVLTGKRLETTTSKYGIGIKSINENPTGLPVGQVRRIKCFANSYSRPYYNKPSPTITRNFNVVSAASAIHPVYDRVFTIREGARLQSFPDDYILIGNTSKKKLGIGNAVPPLLSKALAKEVFNAFHN